MKRNTVRLRSSLARLLRPNESVRAPRFRPRIETLEDRRLLAAAVDLASITGRVFDDFTGDGFTPGEEVAGAALDLYQDDGDGQFEPGAGDPVIRMTMSQSDGTYRFERLPVGGYFVFQPAQQSLGLLQSVAPLVTIDSDDVEGQITTAIDTFDTTEQSVFDDTNDGIPVTSSIAASDAIGGERDLLVNKTSVNGAVQLSVDSPLLPDLLTFDSIATGLGDRRIQWDGFDGDAVTIADTGLSNVDLTANALGVQLQIRADLAGGSAVVRLYSDDSNAGTANRFSTATLPIPATMGSFLSAEFIPYSDFMATSGGGADFANIGAIELEITGAADVNGAAELVGAVGPTIQTRDFANFETADLSLTKVVDDATPNVGQEVTFSIDVTNSGPDNATGVVVTDLLPAGIQFSRFSTASGTYDSISGQWTIGSIGNAATAALTITGTVTSIGVKTNTAEVTAADQFDVDSTPGSNLPAEDDQASTTITPQTIDLSLTKIVDNPAPLLGDSVIFTVAVLNDGPSTATNVAVRDLLPSGMMLTSAVPSLGTYDTASGVWNIASIADSGLATLTLMATLIGTGTLTNTAEVIAADQTDTDSLPDNNDPNEDDQASVSFTVTSADLSLTKTVDNASPNVSENVTFTVTVNNAGPDTATGVSIRDQLPSGTTLVSEVESLGSYDPVTGIWTITSIPVAGSATLTIVVTADTSNPTINAAEVIAADQHDPDSTPDNGAVDEDDYASAQIDAQLIDLSVVKTISEPRPNVGTEVTFLVTVLNDGPSAATGVAVTDALPTGVTLVRNTPSQGTFDPATGIWTVGSLALAQQGTLELTVRIDQILASATNVAQVTAADQPDVDSTPANDVEDEDDQASVQFSTPVADLSLTKAVNNAVPNVGEMVSFDIRLSNDGPDTATGVIVTDLLPSGLLFESTNLSTGTYDPVSGLWTVGSVLSGTTATLNISATVQTPGQKSNTASVTASDQADPDSTPGNNDENEDDQATVSLTPPVIDLSLSKTASPTRPAVGETVTFTLTATNAGPSDATGVAVTDTLPTGVTLIGSQTATGSFDSSTGIWTIGSLAASGTATLELMTTIDTFETHTNIAEVTSATEMDSDSTPGNGEPTEDDFASVSITPSSADLSLVKSVDDSTPNVGSQVTFTLTASNAGPDEAASVVIRDSLPAGLTFVSSTPSLGSYDFGSGDWNIPSIAASSSVTLQILATVDTSGEKTNSAEITASSQFDPDSTPGEGDESEDDQSNVSLIPQLVDLALTKMIDQPTPNVGENIVYSLRLSNDGPSSASGVTVTDQLPAGVTFLSSVPSQGDYNASTGDWTVGSVAVGATPTLQINATVGNTRGETNTAEVTAADQPDSDSEPGNGMADEDDQASVTFTTQLADLSLNMSVDNATPNRNENVTFTLVLDNAGPDDASSVTVRDLLPTGLSFVSSAPSEGTYDAVNGIWSLPNVLSGASETLMIEAQVTSPTPAPNTAEIASADQFDPDSQPGNGLVGEDDIASVTLMPPLIDISVSASVDNDEPVEGDVITITIGSENAGSENATGLSVSAPIPVGLTILSVQPGGGTYDPASGLWNIGPLAVGAATQLTITARVDTRGLKEIPVELVSADQFDIDSTPGNNIESEDDQTELIIRGPRVLSKRLFLSR